MKREILINVAALEVRVALLEDGALTEFYLERARHGLAGNIYKGKVTRVLPGMQAAFVDVGLEKAGFLHVSDIYDSSATVAEVAGEGDVETEPLEDVPVEALADAGPEDGGDPPQSDEGRSDGEGQAPAPAGGKRRRQGRRSRLPIEQQLRRNQEILVQIAKEPMGTKGARLTSSVSLPGRHLVFTPGSNHIGISRRIETAQERNRLRDIVKEVGLNAGGGFIVRTACEGVTKREIQRDVSFLTRLWSSVLKKKNSSPPASLLYGDLDLPLRMVRDLLSSDVDKVWCDDADTYSRIVQFVRTYMPRLRSRVALYTADEPIFDHFNVESQIERALDRKVWLKSGGYLIFDQAEALTAIDVNTGRFVGKRSQDETIIKTNLEAVDEVVKQLRLRNIGGIIIVDFIDMAHAADRKQVSDALAQALKRDKARTSALKISELGLVQMTRKRTRESLEELLTEACPHCGGRGVVKSVPTLAAEVLRGIRREAAHRQLPEMVMVNLSSEIARYLYDHGSKGLEALESRLSIKLVLRSKEGLAPGAFELLQATAAA